MPVNVVLAVGLDAWQFTTQSSALRSAGFVVISVMSNEEAIGHFRAGDFDLVLLGDSISTEDKERLTFLIRATGSRTPVLCIAKSNGGHDHFADATLMGDATSLLKGMRAALAKAAEARAALPVLPSHEVLRATVHRWDGHQTAFPTKYQLSSAG